MRKESQMSTEIVSQATPTRPYLCSVKEFARMVGIKESQARAFIAGEFPPPVIRTNEREVKVITSQVYQWLVDFSAWQAKRARQERLAGREEVVA